MKQILYIIQWVVILVLVLDLFSFILWALSGQFPQGNFYFGMITRNLIMLLI